MDTFQLVGALVPLNIVFLLCLYGADFLVVTVSG